MLGDDTSQEAEGTLWYQYALASVKMSKYESQIVGTSLLQHVNMETPGVLWCSIICLCKNFKVLVIRLQHMQKKQVATVSI